MIRSSTSLAAMAAALIFAAACTGPGAAGGAGAASMAPSTAASAAVAPSAAASRSTDLLADIDIGGGRMMHILCVGPSVPGGPTVIFESGLGGDAGQWSDVIHALDGSVRACAYDRAGDGQSPPATVGRTTTDQVADLRALLAAAKVPPPYLLVGFSLGGWNVMVHEDAHPDDVAGAVMVDVRPPEASARWLAALPPSSPSESDAIKAARDESTTFDTDPTLNREGLYLGTSAAQATATHGFGDKPLIVLAAADTSVVSDGFEAPLAEQLVRIWWEGQDALVARSTVGRLEKVDGTSHGIPFERPDAIADAIREILAD